jgi:GT2 family glycosyltransferase
LIRVRIGIVSWNTDELLARCLSSLQHAAEGLDFDVVVVDNASEDDSVIIAREFTDVIVIANEQNVGYAVAMNQALLHDTGRAAPDVLIALNPDTLAPLRSLTELVEYLWADPALGLVVPQLSNEDGTLQHSVYRFPSPLITFIICIVPARLQRGRLAQRWWLEGRVPHDRAVDVDWAIGAVHVLRAAALNTPTPYCERWFMYAEDMDLCWVLRQQGWRCRLLPDVQVTHTGNASGARAWGARRTRRWWEATYDWYRFRKGAAAVRRYAAINTAGVALLLARARLHRCVIGRRTDQATTARIDALAEILPHHVEMMWAPRTTFLPE